MENSYFQFALSCRNIPLCNRFQEIALRKNLEWNAYGWFDVKLWSHISSSHGRRKPSTDKTCVVSTRWRFQANLVFSRMLQPSTELVIANFAVPSDFLVEGQVDELRTVHPLLTLCFFSTLFLPLFKRKMSSVMDGLF